MSDIESSSAKEIEIDADGEDDELLKRSSSPDPEPEIVRKSDKKVKKDKTNNVKNRSIKNHRKSSSTSTSSSSSRSRSRTRSHKPKRQLSRSRSRSPYHKHRHSRQSRHRRSRSRSDSRREYLSERQSYEHTSNFNSRDKSPTANRRQLMGDRENPMPNRCVGVFGLSLYTQERTLWELFGRYGQINEVQVVYDRQTGRSRGFAFVYYRSMDDAYEAKFRCDGMEIDGRKIRVDFSITEGPHPPTPGAYLGRGADTPYSSRRCSDRRPSSCSQRSGPSCTYGYQRPYSPDRKYY